MDQTSLFQTLLRLNVEDVNTNSAILVNDKTYLYQHNGHAVSLRRERDVVGKEIERMLELAPLNVSISVLGVVFDGHRIDGYVMPLASNIPSNIDVSTKRAYMSQMLSLVQKLHRRQIIHGDLKLNNFLLCSDGQLRLCDFEESQKIGEESEPHSQTYGYRPPWRIRADWDDVPLPLSFDDDYYALGMAIWELLVGSRIFADLDTVEAEAQFVIHGVVVDVGEAQDRNAEDIIWKLIEWGGRGTVKKDGGFRYKVTGPSYELMDSFEYGRLYEEREKRWAALGWEFPVDYDKKIPLEPAGDLWSKF